MEQLTREIGVLTQRSEGLERELGRLQGVLGQRSAEV
jgi:hypothetical protein